MPRWTERLPEKWPPRSGKITNQPTASTAAHFLCCRLLLRHTQQPGGRVAPRPARQPKTCFARLATRPSTGRHANRKPVLPGWRPDLRQAGTPTENLFCQVGDQTFDRPARQPKKHSLQVDEQTCTSIAITRNDQPAGAALLNRTRVRTTNSHSGESGGSDSLPCP
jgi:hypothetical protein